MKKRMEEAKTMDEAIRIGLGLGPPGVKSHRGWLEDRALELARGIIANVGKDDELDWVIEWSEDLTAVLRELKKSNEVSHGA